MYTSSIDDFVVLIFDFASVVINICLHIIVMILRWDWHVNLCLCFY